MKEQTLTEHQSIIHCQQKIWPQLVDAGCVTADKHKIHFKLSALVPSAPTGFHGDDDEDDWSSSSLISASSVVMLFRMKKWKDRCRITSIKNVRMCTVRIKNNQLQTIFLLRTGLYSNDSISYTYAYLGDWNFVEFDL